MFGGVGPNGCPRRALRRCWRQSLSQSAVTAASLNRRGNNRTFHIRHFWRTSERPHRTHRTVRTLFSTSVAGPPRVVSSTDGSSSSSVVGGRPSVNALQNGPNTTSRSLDNLVSSSFAILADHSRIQWDQFFQFSLDLGRYQTQTLKPPHFVDASTYKAMLSIFCHKNASVETLLMLKAMVADGIEFDQQIVGWLRPFVQRRAPPRKAGHTKHNQWSANPIASSGSPVLNENQLLAFKSGSPKWVSGFLEDFILQICSNGGMEESLAWVSLMLEIGISPTDAFLQKLIGHLLDNRLEDCLALLHQLESAEVPFQPNLCITVLDALITTEDWGLALETFALFKKLNGQPTRFLYNSLIQGLCTNGQLRQATRMLESMLADEILPNITTLNALLHGWVKQNHLDVALTLFKTIKQTALTPNIHTYNILLRGYCKALQWEEAVKLFDLMQNERIVPTTMTFNILLRGCYLSGNYDDIPNLLDVMAKAGVSATPNTYNVVMDGLCKIGGLEQALQLLQEMRTQGVEPDVVTVTTLISHLFISGHPHKALDLFQEFRDSGLRIDLRLYNAMIVGLIKSRMHDDAQKLMEGMKNEGLAPDVFSFTALIDAAFKASKVDEAVAHFNTMRENGLTPDHYVYGVMVDGLCKAGKTAHASDLVDSMLTSNSTSVPRTPHLFNMLIDGWFKNGNWQAALTTLEKLKKLGLSPDLHTYNILIAGLCKAKRLPEATAALRAMESHGFQPDHVTYNILIDGWTKNGKWQDALKIFGEMRKNGLTLSVRDFGSLVEGLCSIGQVEEAERVVRQMHSSGVVKPNTVVMTSLIGGFCKADRLDKALGVFRAMKRLGIHANSRTYTVLIHGLCRAKRLQEAVKIRDTMNRDGVRLDTGLCNVLIDGLFKNGLFDEAMATFESMEAKGARPDLFTFNIVIHGMCRQNRLDEAVRLLDNMSECGISPDAVTYTTLMDFVLKAGKVNEALKLFERMKASEVTPSRGTFRVLFEGLIASNHSGHVFAILEVLFSSDEAIPFDKKMFCRLIPFCLQHDHWSLAMRLFVKFREINSWPVLHSRMYFSLVECLYKHSRVEEAKRVVEWMCSDRIRPDKTTLLNLYALFCRNREVQMTIWMLRFCSESGIWIPPRVYRNFIRAFLASDHLDLATETLALLLSDPRRPSLRAIKLNLLIDPTIANRRWDLLEQIVSTALRTHHPQLDLILFFTLERLRQSKAMDGLAVILELIVSLANAPLAPRVVHTIVHAYAIDLIRVADAVAALRRLISTGSKPMAGTAQLLLEKDPGIATQLQASDFPKLSGSDSNLLVFNEPER